MDNSIKKANEFIGHEARDLQTVFAKIHLLEELHRKVQHHLDPALQPYCKIANLVEGKLILVVANGSVATQLRFQIAELLRKFQQDPGLKHIVSIEIKVRPLQHALP